MVASSTSLPTTPAGAHLPEPLCTRHCSFQPLTFQAVGATHTALNPAPLSVLRLVRVGAAGATSLGTVNWNVEATPSSPQRVTPQIWNSCSTPRVIPNTRVFVSLTPMRPPSHTTRLFDTTTTCAR